MSRLIRTTSRGVTTHAKSSKEEGRQSREEAGEEGEEEGEEIALRLLPRFERGSSQLIPSGETDDEGKGRDSLLTPRCHSGYRG